MIKIFRVLHFLSGAVWLGEVLTINFVLLPALRDLPTDRKPEFIRTIFPRLFKLASILALTAVFSGAVLVTLSAGWEKVLLQPFNRWGAAILVGGILGLLLTAFHLVVESKLQPLVRSLSKEGDAEDLNRLLRFLDLVPRAGLGVILVITFLMVAAAHWL